MNASHSPLSSLLRCLFLAAASLVGLGWLLPVSALASPQPQVTLENVPNDVLIGDCFTFQIRFKNLNTTPGYGPFLDLVMDAAGADANTGGGGCDGITFMSATLLTGGPVPLTGGNILQTVDPCPAAPATLCGPLFNHPFGAAPPLSVISAKAGSELTTIVLPFSHYESTQPDLLIEVKACVSKLADAGVPLRLCARGGFRYGATPVDDPGTDPAIVSDPNLDSCLWAQCQPVNPTVLTISKTYAGPENEAATGPNFISIYPLKYTATVNIAAGQTINNLILTDCLPPTAQYQNNVMVMIHGLPAAVTDYTLTQQPILTAPTLAPNNVLEVTFNNAITGTTANNEVVVMFQFFIPEQDANGNLILPTNCSPSIITNVLKAKGDWTPMDLRDLPTIQITATPVEQQLQAKCIAVQKTVSMLQDFNYPGLTPGDYLRYDIDFQVSDYKTVGNLVIEDLLSDPQYFGTPGIVIPTFTVTDQFGTTFGDFSFGADWDVELGASNAVCCLGLGPTLPGATRLIFRVSDAMANQFSGITRHDLGILTGGHATTPVSPVPATGRITFFVQVYDQYFFPANYPGGPATDKHDPVRNCVNLSAEQFTNVNPPALPGPTGNYASDDSKTELAIVSAPFSKVVYAINGSTTLPNPLCFGPGDKVTFRLTKTFPSGDAENVMVRDFPPLPVLKVNSTTWAQASLPVTLTTAGRWAVGSGHSIPVPVVTTPATPNELKFDFGTFDNPANTPRLMEIYFTMMVSSDPFADGLTLNNEAVECEDNTLGQTFCEVALAEIKICEPKLRISKGIVACDNPKAMFSPLLPAPVAFAPPLSALCPRFLGAPPLINSSDLANVPINSDLACADAGDKVTFAIVVENLGSGKYGAYDVTIQDALPAGCFMLVPGTLCVTDGNGAALGFSAVVGTDTMPLFQNGIVLNDPGTGVGALKPYDPLNGANIAIITFDVMLAANVQTGCCTNSVALLNYSNVEGGQNFVTAGFGGPFQDTARVCIQPGFGTKCLVATSLPQTVPNTGDSTTQPADVTLGEVVRFRLMMAIPEGVTPNFAVQDNLPAGLVYLPGNTRVAFVANSSINSSALGTVGQNAGSQFTVLCPTPLNMAPLPSALVSGAVTFNLGTLVNYDNDGDCELVVIDFNALVANTAGNQACVTLVNSFVGLVNGVVASKPSPDNSVTLRVVEPKLTISKHLVTKPQKVGDTFIYEICVTNVAGPCASDAFDVILLDQFPSGVMPSGLVSGSQMSGGGVMGFQAYYIPWFTFSPIYAVAQKIPVGGWACFRFKAKFKNGDCWNSTNTAKVLWSSLPGNNGYPSGSQNPTGGITPGGPGSANGERNWLNAFNGTTGPNDYLAQDRVDLCPDLTIMKTARTNCFMAGLNGTYDIVVKNIGCGPATPPITVTDILPAGLTFVSAAGPNWTVNAAGTVFTYNGTIPPGGSSTVLTLTVSVGLPAVPSVQNCASVFIPHEADTGNNTSCVTVGVLPPKCLFVSNEMITCNGNGTYTYMFDVKNLAAYAVKTLRFTMETPASVTITPDPFTFNPLLQPNASQKVTVQIGGPGAVPGSTICFILSIHDEFDVNCCAASVDKKQCLTLPAPCKATFIPLGSGWKYHDQGANLGTVWRQPAYNDTTWSSGPAQLGYGDGDEATVVNGGPVNNRFVTTYFRHTFNVPDVTAISSLMMRLLRDDGAVVYLNGQEIFRSNLPAFPTPISFNTPALVAIAGAGESFLHQAAVGPGLLVNGANVIAVEIHQANATSSDISFDFELIGNCPPMPAAIVIASPASGASLPLGAVSVEVLASAGSAPITAVEFFVDDVSIGVLTNEPYSLIWSNTLSGLYTLTAVATDADGLGAISDPVFILGHATPTLGTVISQGAVWKYLDDGSDQGAAWSDSAYDDTTWASGPAQLGFGDNDEATVINGGPATNRIITTYFRRTYELEAEFPIASLTGRLLRDDGAAVYLNGQEVFRSNLPEGAIDYLTLTLATTGGDSESQWHVFTIDPALLVPGPNVIAVEVHQAAFTSSDLSFDFELLANAAQTPPVITVQPASQTVTAGASVTFSVVATSDLPLTHQWFRNGVAIPGAQSATLLLNNVQPANSGAVYQVIVSNDFGATPSASATLTVNPDLAGPVIVGISAACASNKVTLTFDEPLDASTATEAFNYSIPGLVINSVTLMPDGRTVCLFCSPFQAGTTYTLTVNGVQDLAGNSIAAGTQASFSCPPTNPVLHISFSTGSIVITWAGGGRLQEADQVTGPWATVAGAASPYTVQNTAEKKYFRLIYP